MNVESQQDRVYDELERLLEAVEQGKFGEDNNFDKDAFEAAFNDEVLMCAYVYETKDLE